MRQTVVMLLALSAGTSAAMAGLISPGNVVIYRIGTGAGSLVNTGSAVFVDEYTPGGVLVQSIAMPTATSGSNRALIASGTATSEGLLSVSPDGSHVALTGYGRDIGGAGSLASSTGATVPRVVGIIPTATGIANTTTALGDFADGNNPRSAVTTNGTDLWVAGGAGGVRYATVGSTTSTQLSTTTTNIRQVNVFDGQLMASTGSGSAFRVGPVGSGLPTTSGQTITNLPGLATSGSPYAFFMADLSLSVPGVDTLYIAADDASALTKFSLVAGTWVSNGVIGIAADAYRGVTGTVDALGNVRLFATRKGGGGATGGGELVTLLDSAGYNGAFAGSATILATAGANMAFRGVGYVTPTPGSLALLGLGGLVAMRRRRSLGLDL